MASISAEGRAAEAATDIVVLPRAGRPPLRMRARMICSHDMPTCLGGELRISLWARSEGSVAVSFTRPVGARLVDDAARADTVCALAEWMEGECSRIRVAQDGFGGSTGLDDLVVRHGARAVTREFMALVGDALADWDAHRSL
jgi:hypothetical protein